MDLQNPGIDQFLALELPWLLQQGARVFVSIVGRSLGEYAELARRLGRTPGLAGIEVNLSPPDAATSGVFDVREPFHAASVVAAVHRDLPRGLPVLAKLRSDLLRVAETARVGGRGRCRGGGRRQRAARRDAGRPPGGAERSCDPAAGPALPDGGARSGARRRR